MSLNTNNFKSGGGGNQEPLPVGGHMARLVQIVDKGVQERDAYQGTAKDPVQQVIFTYELPYQRIEIEGESKPRWISVSRNAVGGPKAALTKDLAVLNPSGGPVDLGSLVGTPVIVNIQQKVDASGRPIEGTKISNISHVPQGMEVPPLENEPRVFDFDNPDHNVWLLLPEWLRSDILSAVNYRGSRVEQMVSWLSTQPPATSEGAPAPAATIPQAMPQPSPQVNAAPGASPAASPQGQPPLPQQEGHQANPYQGQGQVETVIAPQQVSPASSPAPGYHQAPVLPQNTYQGSAPTVAPGTVQAVQGAPQPQPQVNGQPLPPPPTPGY